MTFAENSPNMIERVKFLLTLLILTVFLPQGVKAESVDEIKEKILAIQRNESYRSGRGFGSTPTLAQTKAMVDIMVQIAAVADKNAKTVPAEQAIQKYLQEYTYTENGRFYHFYYLPLSEINVLLSGGAPSQSSQPNAPAAPPRQPDVVQQPPQSATPPSTTQQPPVAANSQSQSSSSTPTTPSGNSPVVSDYEVWNSADDSDIIPVIAGQDTIIELKNILSQYKKLGKIKQTGATENYAEVPSDCYAILFDSMGGVLALLSPANSRQIINQKTKSPDSFANHPDSRFIIWFK